jgi:hypothetical protein
VWNALLPGFLNDNHLKTAFSVAENAVAAAQLED